MVQHEVEPFEMTSREQFARLNQVCCYFRDETGFTVK